MRKRIAGRLHPSLIAVWAAIVAVGNILPTIPILGTGSTFSLATILSPLSGIFFGPLAGALCSAAGGFIGSLVAPHTAWLGMGTFIIGAVTAFTAGCIAWGNWPVVRVNRKGSFIVNGGIIVYLTGTILWFTQETGRAVLLFPLVCYGPGFAALIAGSIFAHRMFADSRHVLKFPAIWLCSFGGLLGGAAVGNFFSLVLYRLPAELWSVIMLAAPVERAVFSLGAAMAGCPLLIGLSKIGIFAGPGYEEDKNLIQP